MKNQNTTPKKAKIFFSVAAAIAVMLNLGGIPAFATSDPVTVVNNLSDIIFSLVRAVGMIILAWGIVQVGISIQSHDPSQRSQGFLCLAGGAIITFTKEILNLIVGG